MIEAVRFHQAAKFLPKTAYEISLAEEDITRTRQTWIRRAFFEPFEMVVNFPLEIFMYDGNTHQ